MKKGVLPAGTHFSQASGSACFTQSFLSVSSAFCSQVIMSEVRIDIYLWRRSDYFRESKVSRGWISTFEAIPHSRSSLCLCRCLRAMSTTGSWPLLHLDLLTQAPASIFSESGGTFSDGFWKSHNGQENTQLSGFWQWWVIQDILPYDFWVVEKPHLIGILAVCLCSPNSSIHGSIQDGNHFLLAILGPLGINQASLLFLVRYTLVNFFLFSDPENWD